MVDNHRLVVALVGQFHLLDKTVVLVDRIVELAVCVGQLFAVDHQFETLGQTGFAAVHLGQRRHLDGVVGDECGLDERAFAGLAEDFVNQLAFAHGLVHFHAAFFGHFAHLVLAHRAQVVARFLFDGLQNGQTAVRGFEADGVVANLDLCGAVDSQTDALQQFLRETHHPIIVFVAHVQLHTGKLRVVVAVHAFVAEITANLVHALKSAYNQALEVQLGCDTQVHVYVQRVVVRDERTSARSACYLLQDRRLHFGVTRLVEHLTHGAQDSGSLQKRVAYSIVDHQVHIALTIALLGIVETIICYAVFVLDDRQRTQTL